MSADLKAVEQAAAELKEARGNRHAAIFTGTLDDANRIADARAKRDRAIRAARTHGATIDQLATAAGIVRKAVKRVTGELNRNRREGS